jgi:hypothetical protein
VVVGVVGWYCGWYTVTVNREPDGNLQIKTNWDTQKATNDTSAFFEKVGQLVGERGEKGGPPAKTPAPTTPTKGDTFEGGWLLSPSKPAGGNR